MNRPFPQIRLTVNGSEVSVAAAPGRRLSEVLREDLRLFGTKVGCDAGDCGACTVLLDGAPVCACLTPVAQAGNREITTIEGLTKEHTIIARAFLQHGAAQCGICTPGMMMCTVALRTRIAKPTRQQAMDAIGGVLCRCTGYQRIVDAICDVDPGLPELAPDPGYAVGARLERLDGIEKVLAKQAFGADYHPSGTLEVRAIRSPHHSATFEIGDVATWIDGAPGLVEVFTALDIPGENRFGVIPSFADQPALAAGKVRHKGEAVAIVVAAPAVFDALDITGFPVTWRAGSTDIDLDHRPQVPLHETRQNNELISGFVRKGDADGALAQSKHVAETSMDTAYVEHAYVEPEAGVAWMDGDTLCVWASTQAPVMDRDDCARILGLPREKVRILPSAVGGGFGAKLDLSVQPLIGLAALKTGKPCRMVWTRSESMAASTKRHPARMRARIGCDARGKITGMTFDGDFNTGAYASWGPTVAVRVPVHASGPYWTPNYRAEARALHTNGPTAGAFRGFGVPQATIIQELLYDDLAAACGIDRLEFRLQNALRDGDTSVCGQVLQAVGIAECLEALRPAWERARAGTEGQAPELRLRRGVGVASCWYGCGNTGLPNPSTVRIGITPDGGLCLHQGATDIGQGADTVITQIVSDALGLPVDRFELIGPDTARTPDCGKTSASRQTFVTGKAAMLAGQTLRKRILAMTNLGENARLMLGESNLLIAEGKRVHELKLAELPVDANGYVLAAEETYDPPTRGLDENGQGAPYAVYGYGAQIAEVEVDTALGTVKVRRMTAAHDLGRVVNPLLAEGQVHGGIAQGLGMALMEEYVPGRTENLHDYLIPTTGDMPEIETIFIEKPDPEGPMGVKGLGEHVLIPTAPAILNAIRHACGARITRLPALPHRVLAAMREAAR